MGFLKMFYPGLGIKRWLILAVIGLVLVSVGASIMGNTSVLGHMEANIMSFIINLFGSNWFLGGAVVFILGILLLVVGFKQLIGSFINAVFPEFARSQVRPVYQEFILSRGPRIVVLGGGTGLSVLLRGLKEYTNNITAIVSVADDGGSSGRLRDQLGILPPGDVRNCIVALADKEALMEKLFNYRFHQGEELAGHNLGNLFLAAMWDMYGNFEEAIGKMSKVLAIRGKVIPATLENVILKAELSDGSIVTGESNISKTSLPIKRVSIDPEQAEPLAEALDALQEADAIILGPGSLYTSIIPNLLISKITEAIKTSPALKIYVCNIMTQPGETDGYTAADHLQSIYEHSSPGLVDYILVNEQPILNQDIIQKYAAEGAQRVVVDVERLRKMGVKILSKSLLEEKELVRHNSQKLAQSIIELIIKQKTGFKRYNFIDRFILLEKYKGKERGN